VLLCGYLRLATLPLPSVPYPLGLTFASGSPGWLTSVLAFASGNLGGFTTGEGSGSPGWLTSVLAFASGNPGGFTTAFASSGYKALNSSGGGRSRSKPRAALKIRLCQYLSQHIDKEDHPTRSYNKQ